MTIEFELNGAPVELKAPDSMPLLWALRDLLGLTGTKFGCGIGMCGSCTVLVDGESVRSCQLPLSGVVDTRVTTIEGLSEDGSHPLQKAWRELQVPQCGYCQSGQLMSAAALLKKSPQPSPDEIDAHMRGNLCRCGTYLRIKKAIQHATQGP